MRMAHPRNESGRLFGRLLPRRWRTQSPRAWETNAVGARTHEGAVPDLLASPATHTFHLELTNDCNLRCVYCAVSQPGYAGVDMDISDFDHLIEALKERKVRTLVVNGHGETTMIPGWHRKILAFADAGFRMSIITNFARLLLDEELAAMARITEVQISIDTHRPEALKVIRRRVDLGNILINMHAVAAMAARLELPRPRFSWSCVVTDRVAADLVDYVRFGLDCGIGDFTLCNLTKYDDIEGAKNVNHVTTMPSEALRRFAADLRDIEAIIAAAGGTLTIQAGLVDSVRLELDRREAA
jgi:MoaA/NifB/PqqE/SkfB family radical SAM enzyme